MPINRRKLPETLLNSRGNEVDIFNIREDHLKKHLSVEKIFKKVAGLESQMERAKQLIMNEIFRFEKWIIKEKNADETEVNFDNLTLTNYSGTLKIVIKTNNDVLDFDEKINIAKAKIDNCLKRWGQGAHRNIAVIIEGVFKVDKQGMINKNAILGLFQYKMDDAEWDEAMDIIKDSISTRIKRTYMTFYKRNNVQEKWQIVDLNFSSLK